MGTHPIFESDFDCLTDLKKMPKPMMDLWVTSSYEEDEEEEEVPPPPPTRKSKKPPTSEPPKSITKTTKVKPSKRATRRNDIEEEDEEEDDYVVQDTRYSRKQPHNDHVSIERESNSRHRTSENRIGRDSRDSRDTNRMSSERDYGRANKTSKTSITKITPITENQKSAITDDSVQSSPTRKSSSHRSFSGAETDNDEMCSWINVKCILFFIFLLSATTVGFTSFLFIRRIQDEIKANAIISSTATTTIESAVDETISVDTGDDIVDLSGSAEDDAGDEDTDGDDTEEVGEDDTEEGGDTEGVDEGIEGDTGGDDSEVGDGEVGDGEVGDGEVGDGEV